VARRPAARRAPGAGVALRRRRDGGRRAGLTNIPDWPGRSKHFKRVVKAF
jgi:hypothetical protein